MRVARAVAVVVFAGLYNLVPAAVASQAATTDESTVPAGLEAPDLTPRQPDVPASPDKAVVADGALREAVASARGAEAANGDTNAPISVEALYDGDRQVVRAGIEAIGVEITGEVPDRLFELRIEPARIPTLEAVGGVTYVRPTLDVGIPFFEPEQPPDPGAGQAIDGEERDLMGVDAWQRAGFVGSGVKVGIIDGFSGTAWNAAQAAGELPAPSGTFCRNLGVVCTALNGTQKHGVAVAEIVHEQAPGAQLYLATIRSTSDLLAAVDWFDANGVTIISRSETAEYDGAGDGTGPTADVIDHAYSLGIAWFNAAGNSAGVEGQRLGSYWRGAWSDPDSDNLMNFNGAYEYLPINCQFGSPYVNGLRWDDFYVAQPTDYDVRIYDQPGGSLLASSLTTQAPGVPPLENFGIPCPNGASWVYMAVNLYSAGGGTNDTLEFMVNGTGLYYWQNPYSAAAPMVDSESPGMVAVGAVDPAAGTEIAPYSSWGPTNDNRKKPDVSAPACVASFTYAPNCFNGTSGATPAVSGAAAVILGSGAAGNPAQLKSFMTVSTVDLGSPGPDNVFGAGEVSLGAPWGGFVKSGPTRLLDTRTGPVPVGRSIGQPLAGGTTLDLKVADIPGVPSTATAVVLNVTSTQATTETGYVTVWPTGKPRPLASNLNLQPGANVPNLVTVQVGVGGQVSMYTNAGSVHLVADLFGYYSTSSNNRLTGISPNRALDTRVGPVPSGRPVGQPLTGGTTIDLPVAGSGGVPADATAVVLNLTSTEASTVNGYLTVWPKGDPRPLASNLNLQPGYNVANLVQVGVGSGGAVSIYTNTGSVHVIADVVGYYRASTGSVFVPVVPSRVFDTRTGFGYPVRAAGVVPQGATVDVQVADVGKIPAYATEIVVNITSTEATSSGGYLTVWPHGTARPPTSALNYRPGVNVPNLVVMKIGSEHAISLYNGGAGTVHYVVDVVGYGW